MPHSRRATRTAIELLLIHVVLSACVVAVVHFAVSPARTHSYETGLRVILFVSVPSFFAFPFLMCKAFQRLFGEWGNVRGDRSALSVPTFGYLCVLGFLLIPININGFMLWWKHERLAGLQTYEFTNLEELVADVDANGIDAYRDSMIHLPIAVRLDEPMGVSGRTAPKLAQGSRIIVHPLVLADQAEKGLGLTNSIHVWWGIVGPSTTPPESGEWFQTVAGDSEVIALEAVQAAVESDRVPEPTIVLQLTRSPEEALARSESGLQLAYLLSQLVPLCCWIFWRAIN